MHPLESLAGLLRWAAKNTAYNLKFIPDDKLAWKPSPEANSALEIVCHVTGAIRAMRPALDGGSEISFPAPGTPPATREEAQEMLTSAAEEYADALVKVSPADLGREITIAGTMKFALARAASMPVVDVIHHHGQIAYIQSILGDKEFHFFERGS